MNTFYQMFTANLKEFIRDKGALFWIFMLPVIFIFLFGLVFSEENMGYGIDFILPGILGMALMQLGLFGSQQFLSLREKKIVRGLSVTPLKRSILLGSEILVRMVSGFGQAAIILFLGILVFDINIAGSILLLFLMILIGALTFISLGYMLINFVSSVEGGNGLAQVVQLPLMFLSGIFFPVEMLPGFMQPVVRIIPLTYLVDGLRQVLVDMPGKFSLSVNFLVLTAWLIFTLGITIKFWKWD